MTRLEHAVEIDRPLNAVYERARDVERYPEFLPGYVSSRIVEWKGDQALIERQAVINRKPYQWRSWVRFEDGAIHFEHATGPLQGMRVHWLFKTLSASRTHLSIIHEMQQAEYAPMVGNLASEVVAAFKRACEQAPV